MEINNEEANNFQYMGGEIEGSDNDMSDEEVEIPFKHHNKQKEIDEAEMNIEIKRCDMLKEGMDENKEKYSINKTLFKLICYQYVDVFKTERGIRMSNEAIEMLHDLAENQCSHHFQIWNFLVFHGKRKTINVADIILLKILNEINFTKINAKVILFLQIIPCVSVS